MQLTDPKLAHWFLKQQRINARFTSIYDMLFANKSLSYIYFRLRYFKWLTLVRFSFHAILVYFLFFYAQTKEFKTISFFWLLSVLILGGWWGALEVLRTKVRDDYYTYERERAAQLIGRWIRLAVIGALGLLAVSIYFGYAAIAKLKSQQAFFFEGLSCIIWLSVAVKMVTATYHAGIYAITRILRPAYSLMVGEFVGAALFWACWPWLHMNALIVMILSSLIVNECIQIKYCQRMYRFRELTPSLNLQIKSPDRFAWADALLAGLSGIIIQFSGAILWLTWLFKQNSAEFSQLYLLLFLLMPLLEAGANWARLFYFDWKKLQRINFTKLQANYDKSVLLLSPFMGTFFWLLASIIGYLVLPSFSWLFMVGLLPLFILRSMIAYLQIRAFTNFYYLDILVSGFIIITGLILAYAFVATWPARCMLITSSFALSLGWLWAYRLPRVNTISASYKYVTYYDWLHQLLATPTTVRIYRIQFIDNLNLAKHMQIIARLTGKVLANEGRLCHYDKNTILLFQPETTDDALLTRTQIVDLSAGLIAGFSSSAKLSHLAGQNMTITQFLLTNLYSKQPLNLAQIPATLAELKAQFMQEHPKGLFFSPAMELGQQASPLPAREIQHLMSQLKIILYTHREDDGKRNYHLLPIYEQGTLAGVFLLPRCGNQSYKIKYWKRLIEAFNVANLLNNVHQVEKIG